MKSRLSPILAAVAVAVSLAGQVHAQQAAASAAVFTEAEVRKVDKDAKKITLKHGEIKNLDMPPMTMVFAVKDAAVLGKVKAGDKVRFKAINDGGKLTVVDIESTK